jgi:hypothetical protein
MRNGFTETTTTDGPIGEVGSALTDWANAPKSMAGIDLMTGEIAPGALLKFQARGKERMSQTPHSTPAGPSRSTRSGAVYARTPYTH